MVLVWQLAWRYLRGKRSANVVPILSRISMSAIAVGSCALIVLFSVFNGFEDLIKDLYKAFYPEIKIVAQKGKFFDFSEAQFQELKKIKGISAISTVLEDNVLLNNEDEQMVATLKGVDNAYFKVNNIKPFIIDGIDTVSDYPMTTALVGLYIADQMGVTANNAYANLTLFYPNSTTSNLTLDPTHAFQSLFVRPAGVFKVQEEFDRKYILAPITSVQNLFLQPNKFSSIEIKLSQNASVSEVQDIIRKMPSLKGFRVESRYEQNRTMYLVMQSEKWAVYALLLFVLLIASFNMVGGLTLLVLEKSKDVAILKAMGATPKMIQLIFITEGVLWSLVGGLIGLGLGLALCYGQLKFHWLKLEGAFIIDAYPVAIRPFDILVVITTVLFVGCLASIYPALRTARVEDPTLKAN